MRIEEVEELAEEFEQVRTHVSDDDEVTLRALTALRAEAWHPIEKAEEMGAKDGRWVLVWLDGEWWDVFWHPKSTGWWMAVWKPLPVDPTHFRFINPPEGS